MTACAVREQPLYRRVSSTDDGGQLNGLTRKLSPVQINGALVSSARLAVLLYNDVCEGARIRHLGQVEQICS
jgi:hypothetical protein